MTNIELLREKIRESGYKISFLASKCGITPQGFYPKLNGKREFSQREITVLRELLKLTPEDVAMIFFAEKVDEASTGKEPA